MEPAGRDAAMPFLLLPFIRFVSHQERTVQSLMRRHLAARPAERASPIRHVPTRL